MADELDEFRDPEKLKLFFEDLDQEIENLAGLYQDARAQNDALRIALMAMLTALDDTMPAVRNIVVQALDEAFEKVNNPLSDSLPETAKEADLEALSDLRTRIDLANKLMARE